MDFRVLFEKNRGLIDPSIMGFFFASSALFGYLSGFYLSEDCFLVFRADG